MNPSPGVVAALLLQPAHREAAAHAPAVHAVGQITSNQAFAALEVVLLHHRGRTVVKQQHRRHQAEVPLLPSLTTMTLPVLVLHRSQCNRFLSHQMHLMSWS
jgi:hypothetical protein